MREGVVQSAIPVSGKALRQTLDELLPNLLFAVN